MESRALLGCICLLTSWLASIFQMLFSLSSISAASSIYSSVYAWSHMVPEA
jgi:hypothetical protein